MSEFTWEVVDEFDEWFSERYARHHRNGTNDALCMLRGYVELYAYETGIVQYMLSYVVPPGNGTPAEWLAFASQLRERGEDQKADAIEAGHAAWCRWCDKREVRT